MGFAVRQLVHPAPRCLRGNMALGSALTVCVHMVVDTLTCKTVQHQQLSVDDNKYGTPEREVSGRLRVWRV